MTSVTHVVGVDPGLVHTGVVRMSFVPTDKKIIVGHKVVLGPAAAAVRVWAVPLGKWPDALFIEAYRPRSNLNSDERMVRAVGELKARMPSAVVLNNTGVKQVVKKSLMELLGVWSFSTKTHHQDLRSAARIALLGMLKDEDMNRLLSDIVAAHLKGDDWHVAH